MGDTQHYIEDVKRYTPDAELDHIKRMIYYCGFVRGSRYFSPVSCSNESDKKHIRDDFCIKILGMDLTEANAAIETVCQIMKRDRIKKRVTFYYLLASYSGKLNTRPVLVEHDKRPSEAHLN